MTQHPKSKYSPKGLFRVNDTWRNTPHLASSLPRLEKNAHLAIAIKALMPDTLKSGWSAYLTDDALTLKVQHNGLATKIKQIAPNIVDGLNITGWDIKDMVVKVSHFNRPIWLIAPPKVEKPKQPRLLTPISAMHIANAIEHVPDESPIKAALIRMIATHGAKKPL